MNAIAIQKPFTHETARDLGQLLETVESHRLALENMRQPLNRQDVSLVQFITEKLLSETQKFWELSTPGTEPQTYDDLRSFSMPDARPWKQLHSQHCQLQLQHNPALQLVRTVIITSQHQKSNASVAMALTSYTNARKSRMSLSLIEWNLSS